MASGTPLHGLSDNQPGILECRTLWLDFGKVLSGSTVSESNSSQSTTNPAQSTQPQTSEVDETLAFAGVDLVQTVDPQEAAAEDSLREKHINIIISYGCH